MKFTRRPDRLRTSLLPLACVAIISLASCGYTLQTSESPLLAKRGIRRIYVKPVVNNTYKPGVENVVYNELLKVISSHRRVKLVTRTEDADAVLSGFVGSATNAPQATTTANQLFPSNVPQLANTVPASAANIPVATYYTATLSCSFKLTATGAPGPEGVKGNKRNTTLWGDSFTQSKIFPVNNQLGPFGTTNALINESEFDRALSDLASGMMADLHESMLAMF